MWSWQEQGEKQTWHKCDASVAAWYEDHFVDKPKREAVEAFVAMLLAVARDMPLAVSNSFKLTHDPGDFIQYIQDDYDYTIRPDPEPDSPSLDDTSPMPLP